MLAGCYSSQIESLFTVSPGVFSATCSKNYRSSIAVKPLKSNAIIYVNTEERYITPNVTQTAESPRLNQVPFARQHHAQETWDGETPGQAVTAGHQKRTSLNSETVGYQTASDSAVTNTWKSERTRPAISTKTAQGALSAAVQRANKAKAVLI